MRLGVIGRTGQLAKALAVHAPEAQFYGREALDLTAAPAVIEAFIAGLDVDALIIAAAYTAVDAAETDGDTAFAVNAVAPAVIAKACAARGIALIHVSTDYVFNGQGHTPYAVSDDCQPLGVYGQSKRVGEQGVLAAHPNAAVVRTSWVFDGTGKNFFTTMIRLSESRETLTVVADQFGRPTYAGHLAEALLTMVDDVAAGRAGGLFHVTGTGPVIHWADFSRAIMDITAAHRGHVTTVTNITTADYPTPAARPAYSALDTSKYEAALGALPDWRDGLKAAYKDWVAAQD